MPDVRCREVVELVTDFLEGTLPVDRRDLVERHLGLVSAFTAERSRGEKS